jgi:Zn ribbon nucleic-acid-binding protein
MEKEEKYCSSCTTKYTIQWDLNQNDMEPSTCPFCGYEVSDDAEEEVEWINKDEDDNWN